MKNEIIKAYELLEELLLKEKELLTRTEIKETVLTKRLYESIKELRLIGANFISVNNCVNGSFDIDCSKLSNGDRLIFMQILNSGNVTISNVH